MIQGDAVSDLRAEGQRSIIEVHVLFLLLTPCEVNVNLDYVYMSLPIYTYML